MAFVVVLKIETNKFFCTDYTVLAPTFNGKDGNNHKIRQMSIEQLSNDCVTILK